MSPSLTGFRALALLCLLGGGASHGTGPTARAPEPASQGGPWAVCAQLHLYSGAGKTKGTGTDEARKAGLGIYDARYSFSSTQQIFEHLLFQGLF